MLGPQLISLEINIVKIDDIFDLYYDVLFRSYDFIEIIWYNWAYRSTIVELGSWDLWQFRSEYI